MNADLVAFLNAQVDEDEAVAKACRSPSPWKAATHASDTWIVTDAAGEPVVYDEGTPTLEEAAHMARHDPARVLAEVAAKRAILARHTPVRSSGRTMCATCLGSFTFWPCPDIRDMTAAYNSRPGYRPAWAP